MSYQVSGKLYMFGFANAWARQMARYQANACMQEPIQDMWFHTYRRNGAVTVYYSVGKSLIAYSKAILSCHTRNRQSTCVLLANSAVIIYQQQQKKLLLYFRTLLLLLCNITKRNGTHKTRRGLQKKKCMQKMGVCTVHAVMPVTRGKESKRYE